ncbi:hypothetical protein HZA99_05200 [Candidatus Woesearchaeota archaeon]|nr:hypothetical protein [Candidatus Woesearchaeota archaeon]
MTIQNDAQKVLNLIYQKYVDENKLIENTDLLNLDLEGNRIDRAIKYLRDIGYIEIVLLMGNNNGLQNFILKKITPRGIQEVEKRLALS